MKKLLILGGTSISSQIVYAAHEMDIAVYVTDYYADSPAKKIADKSFIKIWAVKCPFVMCIHPNKALRVI